MTINSYKEKIVEWFHIVPILMVLVQIPFYYQFFYNRVVYLEYMALYDQILKDSFILMFIVFIVIKKWYLLNITCMIGLSINFIINLYAIIFGLTEECYYYSIIIVEYFIYVIAVIYQLIKLNTK